MPLPGRIWANKKPQAYAQGFDLGEMNKTLGMSLGYFNIPSNKSEGMEN